MPRRKRHLSDKKEPLTFVVSPGAPGYNYCSPVFASDRPCKADVIAIDGNSTRKWVSPQFHESCKRKNAQSPLSKIAPLKFVGDESNIESPKSLKKSKRKSKKPRQKFNAQCPRAPNVFEETQRTHTVEDDQCPHVIAKRLFPGAAQQTEERLKLTFSMDSTIEALCDDVSDIPAPLLDTPELKSVIRHFNPPKSAHKLMADSPLRRKEFTELVQDTPESQYGWTYRQKQMQKKHH